MKLLQILVTWTALQNQAFPEKWLAFGPITVKTSVEHWQNILNNDKMIVISN